MKTNLKTLSLLFIAIMAAAGSASAQQFVVRADGGFAVASKSPYDEAGGSASIAIGSTLDAAAQHELTISLGVIAWGEPEVRGYRPDDARGTTTLRIDGDYYDIPTGNDHFTVDGDFLKLSNGTRIDTNYRPTLAIVPLMANYRFYFGSADSRVRFFLGAGAGFAHMRMESELWREFKRTTGAKIQSDTANSFTWSGTAGLSVRLYKGLKVEASYVYQNIEGADFNMTNVTCKLNRLEAHQFRGGVSWAF